MPGNRSEAPVPHKKDSWAPDSGRTAPGRSLHSTCISASSRVPGPHRSLLCGRRMLAPVQSPRPQIQRMSCMASLHKPCRTPGSSTRTVCISQAVDGPDSNTPCHVACTSCSRPLAIQRKAPLSLRIRSKGSVAVVSRRLNRGYPTRCTACKKSHPARLLCTARRCLCSVHIGPTWTR